jgi:hypothetical protein
MKTAFLFAAGVAALTVSGTAHADAFLKLDSVKGEAAVSDWSFGVCNPSACDTIKSPRDVASGQATGKRMHKPVSTHAHHESESSAGGAGDARTAGYDLKTNKGARTASGVHVATGDLDGDGSADLAYSGTLDEVSSFSLTFQKIEGAYRSMCDGKHFDKVSLRTGADSFDITGATIACYVAEGDSRASGPRLSTDLASSADASSRATKQKQWLPANFRTADMGPSCASGQCAVTMVLTGGQMKHTKTGHVTLLK